MRSQTPRRNRKGSAIILVMIMTASLAALAMSAIYLTNASSLLLRYFARERDYRYAAEAALALGKSRVNRDTLLGLPDDTAKALLSGASLTDASGATIPNVRVNLYGAYTGDTVGRFGQYVTLLAQAYDAGGTRMVRRLDLTAESFSRYAMFTNTFPVGLAYGNGEFIAGRAHSNQRWNSTGSPGPRYYDTVSAVTTVSGTAQYDRGYVAGAAVIPFPTVAKLAALPTYAAAGNTDFTVVSGTAANALSGGKSMSGRLDTTTNAVRGTRLSFRPVDVAGDGTIGEEDGMMMLFDIASGIDTSAIRVDLRRSTGTTQGWITYLNQCGLLATIGGRREFFPMARFREPWVVNRLHTLATQPTFTWPGDSTAMVAGTNAAYSKIMSYGPGFSRCFPVGSPYLMLTERYVTNTAGTCNITTSTSVTPAAWGAPGTSCPQYGGQDTTFTPTVTRCWITQTVFPGTGVCTGNQVSLGAWRAWGGPAMPAIPANIIQAVQVPYLWPLFKPYNLSAKGVIHSSRGPLFVSDTLRGNVTLYVNTGGGQGHVILIDDTVYDMDPAANGALCRNFLGIIAEGNVMIADNALNRPRPDPNAVWRFMGLPHATLHMVTMSLTGTVGVENYAGTQATSPAVQCQGFGTSGGCINQAGGVIEQNITATYTGSTNSGLRENRSVDPCQLTNRKPPFFPSTGRYLDNKYYEVDPNNVDTWSQVKNFYARLRGKSAP